MNQFLKLNSMLLHKKDICFIRIHYVCKCMCFFYWKMFAKFLPGKYGFLPTCTKDFSLKKWPKFVRLSKKNNSERSNFYDR